MAVVVSPRVEILIGTDLVETVGAPLCQAFSARGAEAKVRSAHAVRGTADLDWLVLIALPLQAFLSGLGDEVVRELYRDISSVIRRSLRREREIAGAATGVPRDKPIVLHDEKTKLAVVLDLDLPESALRQLAQLDLSVYRLGPLHYDRSRECWRSELDEAAS